MSFIDLRARPERLTLDPARTAVVVNDMQNAFCSPGGYLELIGFDITPARAVVDNVARVLASAREAGMVIFHGQNGFLPTYADAPEGSPIWWKSPALRYMREHPETKGQILTRGTWDYDFVDELRPLEGEFVPHKSRASCFAGTNLEQMLSARDVRHVIVVGIAINVGVEWTLREAMSKEFFAVLVEDATMPAGGPEIQRATVFNIETFVGWVIGTADLELACQEDRASRG